MQPNNQTPITPVQQPQPDPSLNFTPAVSEPTPQPQQQPQSPQQPQPDPSIAQLSSDIAEIKTALTSQQQEPAQPDPNTQPQPTEQQPQYFNKKYDDWGVLEQDTKTLVTDVVEQKLQEQQQKDQEAQQQMTEQEKQNQQYIDNTVGQLRNAGYLPAVTNEFDPNDPGKQAENELIGYAVYQLGSNDLVKAATELKSRHDRGEVYDYTNKQFVQVNPPSQNPQDQVFGNPGQPEPFGQPTPNQFMPQQPQPYGPQNPYAQPKQYPAGFNAPVSSGNTFMGTQGGAPSINQIRASSYDGLVDQFNRTQ